MLTWFGFCEWFIVCCLFVYLVVSVNFRLRILIVVAWRVQDCDYCRVFVVILYLLISWWLCCLFAAVNSVVYSFICGCCRLFGVC